MREVRDTNDEGNGGGIVIEGVDIEMKNKDTQKAKDWPTNYDFLV